MTNVFPFPPPCGSCGCSPCKCPPCPPFDKTAFGLVSCFAEVEAFRRLIAQIVREQGGGFATGPILGVTDGSNARPGFVGEYVTGSATISFAAYPAVTAVTASPIVLQPGDWDVTVALEAAAAYGAIGFNLAPVPAGMSNNMHGAVWAAAVTSPTIVDSVIIGKTARGNFSVPTLLPFSITVNQSTDSALTGGTATIYVEARRMR